VLNSRGARIFRNVRLLDVQVLTTVVWVSTRIINLRFNLFMTKSHCPRLFSKTALVAGLIALAGAESARAQFFTYAGKGDLLAGFRTPGVGTYELVVNLGNVTNFVALSPGSSMTVTNFSALQLSDAFSSYASLNWSVFATFTGPPNSTYAGYQLDTIWFTAPCVDVNTASTPPTRKSASAQSLVQSLINSTGQGAHTTSANYGTTNIDNNSVLVRELASDSHSLNLSVFISNPQDVTIGDFGGNLASTVENTTPSPFTSAVRSDLYQVVPSGYTDPNSGTSSGAAYLVGYFTFNPSGSLTFTRGSGAVVQNPPPPPQIVSITRVGNLSTVYFTTTNGSYSYGLNYTSSSGLPTPNSSWTASPNTVTGNGLTNSLTDTTTDPNRFYRVTVH